MIVTIENEFLTVEIKQKGAELTRIFNKQTQLEYMWSGDPAFWGKTSPILFPIVGTLKDDTYVYHNKSYTMSRHGFARDLTFQVEQQEGAAVTFLLKNSSESLQKYPFHFELRVRYSLRANDLSVDYSVKNSGNEKMYFSLGAHPAFKVPLLNGTTYNDYYLSFNQSEYLNRWPISGKGLIEAVPVSLGVDINRLSLTKDLFKHDALVFKNLKSDVISLKSDKHQHGFDFRYKQFPFMGIWAAPNADFVCIEPWCGIADSVNHNKELEEKEGINVLHAGETWHRAWQVTAF